MAVRETPGVEQKDLKELAEPAIDALRQYQQLTDGRLTLGVDGLASQELFKPDSVTEARWLGKMVGQVCVVVFTPVSSIPKEVALQNRPEIISEVCMPLLTRRVNDVHADPQIFTGLLDLFVVRDGQAVRKEVGQPPRDNPQLYGAPQKPCHTLTVGNLRAGLCSVERFGDPSALIPALPEHLQVAAFLRITEHADDYANPVHSFDPEPIYPDFGNGHI